MQQVPVGEVARYRAIAISTLPQFVGAEFEVVWADAESVTLSCNRWVFRFGRTAEGSESVRREVGLLSFLRPRVTMTLPQPVLHEGQPVFSQALEIAGEAVTPEIYAGFDPPTRNALALRLAQFYLDLHALPTGRMRTLAIAARPGMSPDEMLAGALAHLPRKHQPFLRRSVKAYRGLTISGDELVFGYFGDIGQNLGFDLTTGTLSGLKGLTQAGFGSRHRDLSGPGEVSADLMLRIVAIYEQLGGKPVDRDLLMLYGVLARFAELAATDVPEARARARAVEWIGLAGSVRRPAVGA